MPRLCWPVPPTRNGPPSQKLPSANREVRPPPEVALDSGESSGVLPEELLETPRKWGLKRPKHALG